MQTTEHYELNLAEGTDTVNPLVIDVPNYETIDEAMYTNYLGTVGLATELLSGSVHALTREGSTPMFRFTATANWTAGDTVTVDGTQVTAKLPTGAALGTGAYVINSEVLCCLQGTLLTFYVPAGSVTTADDSLKLGGELPEYYGTASAVQTATNVANAASLLVDQLSSNLTELQTLNYSQTSIPSTTSFNSVVQQLMNKIFPKVLHIYENGVSSTNWDNVGYVFRNYRNDGGASFNASNITFQVPSNNGSKTTFTDQINVTNYNSLKYVINGVETSINIASLTGEYYIGFCGSYENQVGTIFTAGLVENKSSLGASGTLYKDTSLSSLPTLSRVWLE